MPRKKTVIPDEQPVETLTAETGGEENVSQSPEANALPEAASSGEGASRRGARRR